MPFPTPRRHGALHRLYLLPVLTAMTLWLTPVPGLTAAAHDLPALQEDTAITQLLMADTLGAAAQAPASGAPDHSTPREKKARPSPKQPRMTAEQAASQARDKYNGRVLSVTLEHDQDDPYYRVKILKQGRVRVVTIDP